MSGPALLAFFVAVGMIAQQLAGKAIRDAYFLTHFDAETLPQAMTVAGVLSVGLVFATSALFRRFEPQRVVPAVFAVSAGVFALVWAWSDFAPKPAAVVLFLHTSSVGAVAISGFWSVVNETFDPHTLKQSVGRIASGASAGGVLGGLLTWQGASVLSLESMMLVLVAVNLACGIGIFVLGRSSQSRAAGSGHAKAAPVAALEVFEKTPYLRHVLGLVVLLAVAAACYDYAFKAEAAGSLDGSEALVGFFAVFYAGVGVVTFLVQTLFAARVLRVAGLTWAVSSLPVCIIGFGGLALLQGGLWSYTLLRGLAAVAESSLYRSGYELLFTPLTPEKKRPTKSLIDVGGDKLGVSLGSALALFIVGLVPKLAEVVLLVVAVGCALGALAYARRLYHGYLVALTDSLERGAVRPDDVDLADPGTAGAVERTVALQRTADLVATLDLPASKARRPVGAEESGPMPDPAGAFDLPREVETWARGSAFDLPAVAALESADVSAHRRALARHSPLPAHLVPPVIELLGHRVHGDVAARALRRAAPAHVGQLSDALLDRSRPLRVRAALVPIIASVNDRRATEALLHALQSRPLEVRLRAAYGLAEQRRTSPGLVDQTFIHERIRAELARYPPGSSSPSRRRVVLASTLQLLSLTIPRETLQLAATAVGRGEGRSSGTAREYLDNVVPADILEDLLRLLEMSVASDVVAAKGPDAVLADLEPVDSLSRLIGRLHAWHPGWKTHPG